MFKIAKAFINDDAFIDAAVHIGQKVYKEPYTYFGGNPLGVNFTYTCSDGSVINRPNHNMANILRSLHYLGPILEYFTYNGNDETQNLLREIDENEIKKILFMQLFYTSGRNCEGGLNNPIVADKSRAEAAANFKVYFQDKVDKSPFNDTNEVEQYAHVLNGIYDSSKKDAALRLILSSCQEIDLLRCYPHERFQTNCINKLNKNSKVPNNRDLQKLLLYVQRCIIATGDMLRTQYQTQNILGVHEETSFYFQLKRKAQHLIHAGSKYFVFASKGREDGLFKAASQVDKNGIVGTCKTLQEVVEPIYFHAKKPNTQQEDILALINSGNAMARTFNASPSDISARFETEQLTNSTYVRPLRNNKFCKPHNIRVDLKTGKVREYPEHEYQPINEQKAISIPENLTPPETVSRQEDRGKAKNTIFQKKCSYSLIPQTGVFPVFTGRFQDKLMSEFISVGFLHDSKKMHLHGQKYIWSADTRTSGIDGYFWLAKEKDKKPISNFPGLQAIRDESYCQSLEELKNIINDPENKDDFYSEILASGSIDSLKAIYGTKNDAKHLLAAIYVQCLLRNDYNVERQIIIMDGVNKPRVCSNNELQQIVNEAQERQTRIWYRFLNFFRTSTEKKLLSAIKVASDNNPFGFLNIANTDSVVTKDTSDSEHNNSIPEGELKNNALSAKENQQYVFSKNTNTTSDYSTSNIYRFRSSEASSTNKEEEIGEQQMRITP
ncbi:SidE phosphodiesterase domain-containing protein [Legionella cardiaca]|uniref:SidE phosphodiesterase domain-containing protein n=1 Tax=Legionella cardiaca TaxID=1071983 RepID=A0ABY8ANW5_9GAMM|nr:SidE phosphodiesterase domain-containing protein [Legionella cardiaca]WED41951.1 SidE phosphodiesterase domain-containing protein [Legionella cardiaca]